MKVLLVGVGGVGEAMAVIAQNRPWLEKMVLADYNVKRARQVRRKLGAPRQFPVEWVDAGDRQQIAALAKKHKVDLIMNAVDPVFNEKIFDAAYQCGCLYLDMAMTLSQPHPTRPYQECGVKLGDYQFERAEKWAKKGLLALAGIGVEPGLSDVFAKHAEKHLFDEIDEIGVRDGSNIEVRGYAFAPNFSIWTTIEECLNPPVIWEKARGWFTTETFSEPETFDFPGGIGPVECVNVEHEEVLLIPRWVKCKHERPVPVGPLGQHLARQQGADQSQRRASRAARRGGRLPPRPGPPGRPHGWQDLRRDLGEGDEGGQTPRGLSVSSRRQRNVHEEIRRASRRLADGGQPRHRHGAAGNRRVARERRAGAGSL